MTPATERRAPPGLLDKFLGRLERWFQGGPEHELERLGQDEMALIAHDIGLSMNELERLTRSRSDGLLLYQRLASLGLDGETVKRQGYLRDLERTCALCDSQDMCRHDLSERPDTDEWERYCPNVETLTHLAAEAKAREQGSKS